MMAPSNIHTTGRLPWQWGNNYIPSLSVTNLPTVEEPKRFVADVRSSSATRTPARGTTRHPLAEPVAAIQPRLAPKKPAIRGNLLSRDDSRSQFFSLVPSPGESPSQVAARMSKNTDTAPQSNREEKFQYTDSVNDLYD
ncbi:hypothetical protein E4U32_001520 [Claviceps aff. humidiphila group G2b]|nr:hypothetical protein E4U32_001520 [Claviceps aff. humidiphila group G2b]